MSLQRKTPLKRTPFRLSNVTAKRRPQRKTGPTVKVRDLVWAREEGHCVACGWYCTGDYSLQHRRARGMGGTKDAATNSPSALVLVCGSATTLCHGYIEANPQWALEHGYRVPQGVDPAGVPVWVQAEGLVWLDDRGGYIRGPGGVR